MIGKLIACAMLLALAACDECNAPQCSQEYKDHETLQWLERAELERATGKKHECTPSGRVCWEADGLK